MRLPVTGIKMPLTGGIAPVDRSENWDKLLFDANTVECAEWQFPMPDDYRSNLAAKIWYTRASVASGTTIEFNISMAAVTPGDAIDIEAKTLAAVNPCDDTSIPTIAGRLDVISCNLLTTDNAAAGDIVRLRLCNDIADSASGDREVQAVQLTYAR